MAVHRAWARQVTSGRARLAPPEGRGPIPPATRPRLIRDVLRPGERDRHRVKAPEPPVPLLARNHDAVSEIAEAPRRRVAELQRAVRQHRSGWLVRPRSSR